MISRQEPYTESIWVGPDYASLGTRVFCFAIDLIVAGVFPVLALFLTPILGEFGIQIGLFSAAGYLLMKDAIENGQSLGKRAKWIQVVDQRTGNPCTSGQSFLRNILLLLGPIDWAFAFGREPKRLGDRIAGTIVVNRPI